MRQQVAKQQVELKDLVKCGFQWVMQTYQDAYSPQQGDCK